MPMTHRSFVLVLALGPAASVFAQLDAFRYDPGLVPVGRVYQYLKSNRDGTHPANVTVRVAAPDRLEALKWDEGGDSAAYVVAFLDWTRFSVRRFESWQLRRNEAPQLRATLDVDEDGVAVASFLPEKPIRLSAWPWHSYDFDFSSLGITLPHLVRPEADFSFHRTDIMQEEGNVDFREVGAVRARYETAESRGRTEARRYKLDGPGLLDTEGILWVDKSEGHIVELELAIPDEPGFVDGRLKLLEVESMTGDEWESYKRSRVGN